MNAVKLETFPISIVGDALDWFNDLPENSITTWDQLKEAFIGEFYSVRTQRRLENMIRSFEQDDGEDVVDTWVLFKKMLRNCPGHNLTREQYVELFFDGLDKKSKRELGYAFGGSLNNITPNEGYRILEGMAKDNSTMDDERFLNNERKMKKGTREGRVARAEVSDDSGVIGEIQALSARMDKGFTAQEARFGALERDVKVLADGCDHCGDTHYSDECPNPAPEDVNYVQNQPQGSFHRNTGFQNRSSGNPSYNSSFQTNNTRFSGNRRQRDSYQNQPQQQTQQGQGSGSSSFSNTDPNVELREM
uniref:uncharacterized protein LOC122609093 n=1 Tax=Erigeron canadensis TaxID=72917 RepID=UPI001CB97E0D|nr:uncharacterized protein LOC122609093 [Erigeron canadensis]